MRLGALKQHINKVQNKLKYIFNIKTIKFDLQLKQINFLENRINLKNIYCFDNQIII